MSEDAKYACGFCGSKTSGDDGFIYCPYCGEPYDAEGYEPSHPMPCVRDEHGEIRKQTVKQLVQKINEELDEFKNEINGWCWDLATFERTEKNDAEWKKSIAEEAADVITAVTTLEEYLGMDAAMRDEAQRRVNEKNRKRGRL